MCTSYELNTLILIVLLRNLVFSLVKPLRGAKWKRRPIPLFCSIHRFSDKFNKQFWLHSIQVEARDLTSKFIIFSISHFPFSISFSEKLSWFTARSLSPSESKATCNRRIIFKETYFQQIVACTRSCLHIDNDKLNFFSMHNITSNTSTRLINLYR